MNHKRIIDWITYAVNMLVALPIFRFIRVAIFGLTVKITEMNPPE